MPGKLAYLLVFAAASWCVGAAILLVAVQTRSPPAVEIGHLLNLPADLDRKYPDLAGCRQS